MGRGRAGKVQLVLEVVLVLRLPLQADLLPEAPGLAPATCDTAQVRGRPRGRGHWGVPAGTGALGGARRDEGTRGRPWGQGPLPERTHLRVCQPQPCLIPVCEPGKGRKVQNGPVKAPGAAQQAGGGGCRGLWPRGEAAAAGNDNRGEAAPGRSAGGLGHPEPAAAATASLTRPQGSRRGGRSAGVG